MNNRGEDGVSLWDDEDGFFYDVLNVPNQGEFPMRTRSMVGLIPLYAVDTLEPELLKRLPNFKRRLDWFIANRPGYTQNQACMFTPVPVSGGSCRSLTARNSVVSSATC